MLFETEMYSPFGRSLVDARHFGEYEALTAAAGATPPTRPSG